MLEVIPFPLPLATPRGQAVGTQLSFPPPHPVSPFSPGLVPVFSFHCHPFVSICLHAPIRAHLWQERWLHYGRGNCYQGPLPRSAHNPHRLFRLPCSHVAFSSGPKCPTHLVLNSNPSLYFFSLHHPRCRSPIENLPAHSSPQELDMSALSQP